MRRSACSGLLSAAYLARFYNSLFNQSIVASLIETDIDDVAAGGPWTPRDLVVVKSAKISSLYRCS